MTPVPAADRAKTFFLWYYYPWYLRSYYGRNPEVAALAFAAHRRRLLDDHFWWPADLCDRMAEVGYETEFVIGNAEALQKRWAEENGFRASASGNWEREIILEQARRYQPDVVWVASHFDYFGPFIRELRKHAGKVIAWVGEPWPNPPDVDGISVLVTENSGTFKSVQHKFERVVVTKPGFSPRILEAAGRAPRRFDVTFVGQFARVHKRRADVVAYLLRNGIDVKVFGLVAEDTLASRRQGLRLAAWQLLRRRDGRGALRALRRALAPTPHERDLDTIGADIAPPVYGLDMHRLLAASRMTLNIHGDIAGNYAGNMRMFEATGMGTCLITEHADNVADLFVPGEEILTYRSKEDLLALIRRALAGEIDVERIAKAGQQRTLRQHTLDRVLSDVAPVLRR